MSPIMRNETRKPSQFFTIANTELDFIAILNTFMFESVHADKHIQGHLIWLRDSESNELEK